MVAHAGLTETRTRPAKATRPLSRPAKPAAKTPAKSKAPAKPAAKVAADKLKKARQSKQAPARAPMRAATPAVGPKARAAARPHLSIDRLHQVSLRASDLDAAVAFYRDLLGLEFIARFDPPGLAFFSLGSSVRLLLSAEASAATLYFYVTDLDAAVNTLARAGVSFLQKPSMLHRDEQGHFGKKGAEEWMAFFRDPSGNLLALASRR